MTPNTEASLGCRPAPSTLELKSKLLLSLPTTESTCVASDGNNISESLNKMCALVTGESETSWEDVFVCYSDNVKINIWQFATEENATRAAACLNAIQTADTTFGDLPKPAFETLTLSNGGCYIKSTDSAKCAIAAGEMSDAVGAVECKTVGSNVVVGPVGSCFESSGSMITKNFETVCHNLLGISSPNIKFDALDFTDRAICESGDKWRFQDTETCTMFTACLNTFYQDSFNTDAPTSAPTPAPTPTPTPAPIALPTPQPTPPPTLKPTNIQEVKSYCKAQQCSNTCIGASHCGWHATKGCKPLSSGQRSLNMMRDGSVVLPAEGICA